MRVDWMDRPLTAVEALTDHEIGVALQYIGPVGGVAQYTSEELKDDRTWQNDDVVCDALGAALEYWLSRRALYTVTIHTCAGEVKVGEYIHKGAIDGPWPSREYEPTWRA